MKFFKLLSTYFPGPTIDNFKSLVWTERYRAPGEFKLEVENDITVLAMLPLGSLVSHTDTLEVMIVENHEVLRGERNILQISVTGRSFEVFAENRTTAGCEQALEDASGNPIVETVTGLPASVATTILRGRMQPGTASAENAIPNLAISSSMRIPGITSVAAVIERGDLYSQVIKLIALVDAGIRNVRPNGAQTTLNMIVNDGADLRATVIFYALNEDLTDCKYFYSIQDYKNFATVAIKNGWGIYRSYTADIPTGTGLDRRSMYIAADDLKGPYSSPADVLIPPDARAQSELEQVPPLYLMEAKVTETAKPKFKIHYDVGDIVTVLGEYDHAEAMRVTEHIYTFDDKGMHGYPTLSEV